MKWFNNLKISVKLLSGFIFVALVAGVVGVVGVLNLTNIQANDTKLYEKVTVPIEQMLNISTTYQKFRVSIREYISAVDGQTKNSSLTAIEDRKKELAAMLPEFYKTLLTKDGQDVYADLMLNLNNVYTMLEDVKVKVDKGDTAGALASVTATGEVGKVSKIVQDDIAKLTELKMNIAKDTYDGNMLAGQTAINTMLAIVAAAVLIAILLGIVISTSISRPVGKLVQVADRIAGGDLNIDVNINTKDEVGTLARSFAAMAENINEAMTNISLAAEQVATGSKQVSDSSMALSQGATEQASSVEELTASLEEISAQTRQNADSANQANELAENAKLNAMQGNSQMKEMLNSMDEINESSGNISKIIKVIDEIAFQTNILALNAAVEAARAGQHGKGFAVVAEEVRNLAARSANAAKETTDMIEGSIKKVESGTKIANDTAIALDRIVEGVSKVASLVNNIAIASNEQASGITQVNQGIMQVSQVVQTNSATSQESAAASEELASQAELMKEQVSRFKIKKSGHHSSSIKETENDRIDFHRNDEVYMSQRHPSDDSHKDAIWSGARKINLSDKEFGKY